MSNLGRDVAYNGLAGFLIGYGTRMGYDAHNRRALLRKYHETGEIPKKKSLGTAILLVLAFGSLGLFYVAPRIAVPMSMIDFPLMFLIVFTILIRPFTIFIALIATIIILGKFHAISPRSFSSINRMLINLLWDCFRVSPPTHSTF